MERSQEEEKPPGNNPPGYIGKKVRIRSRFSGILVPFRVLAKESSVLKAIKSFRNA